MSAPIEPQDYVGGVTVVDIGDARVARGMTRRPFQSCRHRAMVYDPRERRVWCSDCETDVDAFDAFTILVEHFSSAQSNIDRQRREVGEAKAATIHLIAAREMEQHWRRKHTVPACPHCHAGIFAEDAVSLGSISKEIERARRRRKAEGK